MADREAWNPAARAGRKLHLGIDAKTGMIVASTLTGKEVDDAAELGPLLDQVDQPLAAVAGWRR